MLPHLSLSNTKRSCFKSSRAVMIINKREEKIADQLALPAYGTSKMGFLFRRTCTVRLRAATCRPLLLTNKLILLWVPGGLDTQMMLGFSVVASVVLDTALHMHTLLRTWDTCIQYLFGWFQGTSRSICMIVVWLAAGRIAVLICRQTMQITYDDG